MEIRTGKVNTTELETDPPPVFISPRNINRPIKEVETKLIAIHGNT